MKAFLKRILELDKILLSSILVISTISLLSIYSSQGLGTALRQATFVGIGLLVYLIVSFLDWRIFKENSLLVLGFYLFTVGLLGGLFYFAPTIRSVQRWYQVGPILIDPSVLAMLALIILLAKFFSARHAELYRVRHIILSGVYAFIPAYLISQQPNMGTALIFVVLWGGILLVSGIRLKHFLILCLVGLLCFGLVWGFVMQDYQRKRVKSFLNPELDPQGVGWGARQARIAIGNGGLLGQGLQQGPQTQYGFLPVPHTDFIFAAIAEEMGFVGVFALLVAIGVLVWRIMKIIFSVNMNFPRLFATGFLIIFMFQAFVNIGMNLELLPVTGTPLPLVSYGGSSVIFTFICLGILENIRYTTNWT